MKPSVDEYLPLSPATLHVLLALTAGELHGYAIMMEVARQSGGQYKMGPGTLYDNIKKLLKLGFIEEAPESKERSGSPDDAAPRRRYRLKQLGRAVLAAETERLTAVLRHARRGLALRREFQS